MTTKAERKANAYADQAREYGLTAEITVNHEDATLYSDGSIMLPASTIAWLVIRETDLGIFGTELTAGWRSVDAGQTGHRASTRYVAGYKTATFIKTRKLPSEKRFASWLSIFAYKH
jgi:hypothetical protein